MWGNEPGSLPDWIENAYDILVTAIEEGNEVSRSQAREQLLAHNEFPAEPEDADFAIDTLLDSGWLYEVNGCIRITAPER